MATEEKSTQMEPSEGAGNEFAPELTPAKFEEYRTKTLAPEITAETSKREVKLKNAEQKKVNRQYKTCSLLQAESACNEYAKISNCITTWLGQSTIEIQGIIATQITAGAEIDAALLAAVQSIKTAKSKIKAVKDAACKLDNCVQDSCNSEQLKALIKGFKTSFTGEVEAIVDKAGMANENGNHVFETGVNVVGIAKFICMPSLKGYGDALKTEVDKLTANVADNIKFNAGEKEKAQKDLTTAIQEYSTASYQFFATDLCKQSLESTNSYAENPEYTGGNTLESINDKVAVSFEQC